MVGPMVVVFFVAPFIITLTAMTFFFCLLLSSGVSVDCKVCVWIIATLPFDSVFLPPISRTVRVNFRRKKFGRNFWRPPDDANGDRVCSHRRSPRRREHDVMIASYYDRCVLNA